MVNLPKFSIATKLYAIFALLATATVILALIGAVNAQREAALMQEFEAAFQGAQSAERINGLIYAAGMEARGVATATDPAAAKSFAASLIRNNDRIGDVVTEWQWSLPASENAQFGLLAASIKRFQEYNRGLAARATSGGAVPAGGWDDPEASRAMMAALSKDLEAFGQIYSHRAKRIYSDIDRGVETTAWLMMVLGAFAIVLAAAGAFLIWRA